MTQTLIDLYGWQWSLRITGLIAGGGLHRLVLLPIPQLNVCLLVIGICGLFIRTRFELVKQSPKLFDTSFFKDYKFVMLYCSFFIQQWGFFVREWTVSLRRDYFLTISEPSVQLHAFLRGQRRNDFSARRFGSRSLKRLICHRTHRHRRVCRSFGTHQRILDLHDSDAAVHAPHLAVCDIVRCSLLVRHSLWFLFRRVYFLVPDRHRRAFWTCESRKPDGVDLYFDSCWELGGLASRWRDPWDNSDRGP